MARWPARDPGSSKSPHHFTTIKEEESFTTVPLLHFTVYKDVIYICIFIVHLHNPIYTMWPCYTGIQRYNLNVDVNI